MRKKFSVVLTLALISILLGGTVDLPEFGSENSPANNYVSRTYIEETTKKTGALNIVTGIILDYRAFDTLIEASVIFTGVMAVMMLLKKEGAKYE